MIQDTPCFVKEEAFLDKNKYTRPGIIRKHTNGIVMHYTMVPGATAQNQRDSFNREHVKRYRSAHYVIGIKGEILHIIPDNEKSYHCGAWIYKPGIVDHFGPDPNMTAIGIEMCHKHHDGRFELATLYYAKLLVGYLCERYDLNPITEIYRHYDITGKICPKHWVLEPQEFEEFKLAVKGNRG